MKKLLMLLCAISMTFCIAGTSNATLWNGHNYIVVNYDYLSWDDATSDMLTNLGSDYHLATITSQGEQDFIASIVTSGNEYWLGGYQDPSDEVDAGANWYWVNNEGKFWNNDEVLDMYANWDTGEPNDNDIAGSGSEQYLAMWGNKSTWDWDWTWNDEETLDEITGYIAESTLSTLVPEPISSTLFLLGSAVFGLFGYKKRKCKA